MRASVEAPLGAVEEVDRHRTIHDEAKAGLVNRPS